MTEAEALNNTRMMREAREPLQKEWRAATDAALDIADKIELLQEQLREAQRRKDRAWLAIVSEDVARRATLSDQSPGANG